MARVSVKRPLKFEQEQQLFERFFVALSSLRNFQEAEAFLLEFLTKQELEMLTKRLELYKRILKEQKYRGIIKDLKVTAQTISDTKKKLDRADVYFLRVLRKMLEFDKKM